MEILTAMVVGVTLLLPASGAFAQGGNMMNGNNWGGGYFMGGMHGLCWIFWVVLIGLLVFYRWGRPSEQRHRSRETPQQTLQRRLANGEVTPDDYEKRKALLERDAGAET